MNRPRCFFFMIMCLILGGLTAAPAWAINPPEPLSGGQFIRAKGTKASDAFAEINRPGYGRSFEDYHYGDGLRAANLHLSPYIGYTREWDSNVFLSSSDRQSDWINRLIWGVDAEMPLMEAQHVLRAGVQSESEWFRRFSNQDHTDWTFQGGGTFNFNHFSLEIFEEFQRTVERAGTELTARTDRKENYLVGLLTVPFAQFFMETEVSHYHLRFRDSVTNPFDRDEIQVFPRLGINIADRTQALLEYGYAHGRYRRESDRNFNNHQGSVGLRGFLGEADLVSYQIWAGWDFRRYRADEFKNYHGFVARGDLFYNPAPRSLFVFSGQRRPVESVAAGQTYYVLNELSARWRQEIFDNFFTNVQGAFRFNNYSNDRFDFVWEPSVGVEYILPGNILGIFTEYRFSGRESDVSGFDYHRNRWNFGVRAEL